MLAEILVPLAKPEQTTAKYIVKRKYNYYGSRHKGVLISLLHQIPHGKHGNICLAPCPFSQLSLGMWESSVSPPLSDLSGLLTGMANCAMWHMAKHTNVNSGHIIITMFAKYIGDEVLMT